MGYGKLRYSLYLISGGTQQFVRPYLGHWVDGWVSLYCGGKDLSEQTPGRTVRCQNGIVVNNFRTAVRSKFIVDGSVRLAEAFRVNTGCDGKHGLHCHGGVTFRTNFILY